MHDPLFEAVPDLDSRTIYLRGELDLDGVPSFVTALEVMALAGMPRLTIDLRDLEYLGSDGVRCLVLARSSGMTIVLQGINPMHQRLIEVNDLAELFEVVVDGDGHGAG